MFHFSSPQKITVSHIFEQTKQTDKQAIVFERSNTVVHHLLKIQSYYVRKTNTHSSFYLKLKIPKMAVSVISQGQTL